MRPGLRAACILLILAESSGGASQDKAQGSSDLEQCSATALIAELRIKSCTAVIQSGQVSGAELAKLYLRRGGAHFEIHQLDLAMADFSQAVRLDPSNPAGFLDRAIVYANQADYDRALPDLDEALRLSPQNYTVLKERASVYKAKGDYDRALKDLDENIRLYPGSSAPWGDRGDFFRTRGDYDRAIQDYGSALRVYPKAAWAFDHRGDAYSAKGDYAHALEDYEQARADPFWDKMGAEKRGHTRFFLGQYAGAEKEFAQAMSARPHDSINALWNYLAQAHAGRPSALAELRKNAPQADDVLWRAKLVDLYLGKATPEEALAATAKEGAFERMTRLQALFYLGEYALLHQDKARATQWFRECVSLWPVDLAEAEYRGAKAELARLTHAAD